MSKCANRWGRLPIGQQLVPVYMVIETETLRFIGNQFDPYNVWHLSIYIIVLIRSWSADWPELTSMPIEFCNCARLCSELTGHVWIRPLCSAWR
jgi:hypothetical protein